MQNWIVQQIRDNFLYLFDIKTFKLINVLIISDLPMVYCINMLKEAPVLLFPKWMTLTSESRLLPNFYSDYKIYQLIFSKIEPIVNA